MSTLKIVTASTVGRLAKACALAALLILTATSQGQGQTTTYDNVPPPAVGIHPRVVTTPSELQALQQRVGFITTGTIVPAAQTAYGQLLSYAIDLTGPNGSDYKYVTAMGNGAVLSATENLSATPPQMTDADYQTVSLAVGQAALGMWITYGHTGNVTSGSGTITNLSAGTGSLTLGETVSGYGFPTGTITAIYAPSEIVVSTTATVTQTGVPLMITGNITFTGNTTVNSTFVTGVTPGAQGLFYGEAVSGTGTLVIPAGTTINSVVNSSEINLTAKAKQTQAGVTFTVATSVTPVLTALMNYVNNVHRPLPIGTLSMDSSRNPPGIAFAYDYLYNALSTTNQNNIRNWLMTVLAPVYAGGQGNAIGWGETGGLNTNPQRGSNWTGFIYGGLGFEYLSVEGETDTFTSTTNTFNPTWIQNLQLSISDYLNLNAQQGCPIEGIWYYAYGMSHGSYMSDAMHRRMNYNNNIYQIVSDPWANANYTNGTASIPSYWTYDMFPFGPDANDILGDTSPQQIGVSEIYEHLALSNPTNSIMQWVYRQHESSPLGGALYPSSDVLWATIPSGTVTDASLGLPTSHYFSDTGLLYARTGWGDTNATYATFISNPTDFGGHLHADANSITVASKDGLWLMDGGGWLPWDIFRNIVLIDGKGPGYPPLPGQIIDEQTNSWCTAISGDASAAYDYYQLGGNPTNNETTNFPGTTIKVNPYNPVNYACRSMFVMQGDVPNGVYPYLIISDELQSAASGSHRYTWQAETPLNHQITGTLNNVSLYTMDTGSYVQPNTNTPMTVSFNTTTSGAYTLWMLMGHPSTTSPGNTGPLLIMDGSTTNKDAMDYADNALPHWQQIFRPSYDSGDNYLDPGTTLAGGAHTLSITGDYYGNYTNNTYAAFMAIPSSGGGAAGTSVTGNLNTNSIVTAVSPGTGSLTVGQQVTGQGIPGGAVITAINSGTQFTMSYNATLVTNGAPLTVGQFDGHMLNVNPTATLPAGTIGPIRFVGGTGVSLPAGWTAMRGIPSPQFGVMMINPNRYNVQSTGSVFYRTRPDSLAAYGPENLLQFTQTNSGPQNFTCMIYPRTQGTQGDPVESGTYPNQTIQWTGTNGTTTDVWNFNVSTNGGNYISVTRGSQTILLQSQ